MVAHPSGRVNLERRGAIARVSLDRSDAPGALHRGLLIELQDVFRALDGDHECEILILSGIDGLVSPSNDNETAVECDCECADAELIAYQRAVDILENMRIVTIASLKGTIDDGVSDLALATDLVFQSEQTDEDKPQIKWATSLNPSGKAKLARVLHRFQELESEILKMIYQPAAATGDAAEHRSAGALGRARRAQS